MDCGEAFGQNSKRLAELETQLEQARRGDDELAETQRVEERRYRNLWRMIIAPELVGGAILAAWFYKFPPQKVTHEWTGYGLLLASAPFVFLLCRWVLRFKRRNHWRTWRDNDVFHAVAQWWEPDLRKFLIQV